MSNVSNSSPRTDRPFTPRARRSPRRGFATAALLLAVVGLSQVGQAAAPSGRYSVTSDTVLDNKTGLVWQRNIDTANQRDQDQAKTYCAGVSLAGSGWRVPSVKELSTLVDDTVQFPAWDKSAFPDTDGFYYFMSSSPGNWQVFFALGTVTNDRSTTYVRCVR
ncbi:MAG TPA: DUF1566 domain-containing protein [Polyangiaceae bacterium]|nr:DUF1566 domain-containing protein [Polyangiaceae bacterium]